MCYKSIYFRSKSKWLKVQIDSCSKRAVQRNAKKIMAMDRNPGAVWVVSLEMLMAWASFIYCFCHSLLHKQLWLWLYPLYLYRSLGTNVWQKGLMMVGLVCWSVCNDFLQVNMGMRISLNTDSSIHQFIYLFTHSSGIYWALTICQAILCLHWEYRLTKSKLNN